MTPSHAQDPVPGGAPTVGVVIPAYNASRFLAPALDSVFRQTYPIARVVVVDDGSNDDYGPVLEPYGERVTYVRVENGGPGRARNVGVAALDTDWVAFLDADDVWADDKIEKQMRRVTASAGCGLVYCGKTLIDVSGRIVGLFAQSEFPEGDLLLKLLHENHISTASVVVANRGVLIELGGFNEAPDIKPSEDYELWLRIASRHPIAAVRERLVHYRIHDSNLTRDTARRYRALLAVFDSVEADLRSARRLTAQATAALRQRRIAVHDEFARSFVFLRDYSRARTAIDGLASLRRAQPLLFTVVQYAPDWALHIGQSVRRFVSRAR